MMGGGGHCRKQRPNFRSLKKTKKAWTTSRRTQWKNKNQNHLSLASGLQPNPAHHHKKTNIYFKTKQHTKKSPNALDAPGAPLNTTSYIIGAKLDQSPSDCSSSPVFDGYGSMKGLLDFQPTTTKMSKGTSDSDGISKWVREELSGSSDLGASNREFEDSGLVCFPSDHKIVPSLLALKIRNQDDQIAELEEESVMLKERVVHMEQELVGLKHRVGVLEERDAMRLVEACSCVASFAL